MRLIRDYIIDCPRKSITDKKARADALAALYSLASCPEPTSAKDARDCALKIAPIYCYPADYPGIDEAAAEIERFAQDRSDKFQRMFSYAAEVSGKLEIKCKQAMIESQAEVNALVARAEAAEAEAKAAYTLAIEVFFDWLDWDEGGIVEEFTVESEEELRAYFVKTFSERAALASREGKS